VSPAETAFGATSRPESAVRSRRAAHAVTGPPHPDGGFRRGDVRINGFRMAYLEAGPQDGPLALCLHGFPDHALTWERLLPELAGAGFRAVAPWMRGYHPTEVPPGRHYQLGALSADANELHDLLGGDERAVLIGHDWGAVAAYGAASAEPERWRRLVGLSVPPIPAWLPDALLAPDQLRRSWYMLFFQLPWLPERLLRRDGYDPLLRAWGRDLGGDAEHVDALRRTFSAPGTLRAALGYYRALLDPIRHASRYHRETLAQLRLPPQPTLFLCGEDDRALSPRWVAPARALLSTGSPAAVVPGSHWLHLEHPEQVNARILDFLT
jgi:pimeloyl-ACP methyl ester carboxylesterase